MLLRASLATRLVVTVLLTAIAAYGAFVALTMMGLERSLNRQAEQLNTLSERKLARTLDNETKLARARMSVLKTNVARRMESIAQRSDVLRAITSGNVVAMSELLGRAATLAEIDGLIVVDAKMRVIGAHSGEIELLGVHHKLQSSSLMGQLRNVLVLGDRHAPHFYLGAMKLDSESGPIFGAFQPSQLAVVVAFPVFDEFGDISGAILGHRRIREREETLLQLAAIEGNPLLIQAEGRMVSSAGEIDPGVTVKEGAGKLLHLSSDGKFWSRCTPLFDGYTICSLAPLEDLHVLRNEMVKVAEGEGRSLITWLFIVSMASLMSFAAVTFWSAQKIVEPLGSITGAVRAVARGDWKSEVLGTERKDEIGDIAKAVMVLQRSMEERDRLKLDVANAEVINKRRQALEESIRKFDKLMRTELLEVNDGVDKMEEMARDLARISAIAEGEAAEVAFLTDRTVQSLRKAGQGGDRTEEPAIPQAASDYRNASADASVASLRAILEAAYRQDAQSVRSLSGMISRLESGLEKLSRPDDDGIYASQSSMSEALAAAREAIALLKAQDQATQAIFNELAKVEAGTSSVSGGVKRLRTTIEETRGASVKVVNSAEEMAEKAVNLNLTVKSFLHEVLVH